jgi:hypothetical protein
MTSSALSTATPESEATTVSVRVVQAVADAKGVDPAALETPLYEVVDPDALEAVVASVPSSTPASVQFRFLGHDVLVTGAGDVQVS